MTITACYHCVRCGRAMKAATDTGMGPKCTRAVLGAKPRRTRIGRPAPRRVEDPRQLVLLEVMA
jgi:DNA-directed RNA polymerase subunit RPC12/RpoP